MNYPGKRFIQLVALVAGLILQARPSWSQRADSVFNVDVQRFGELHSVAASPQGRVAVLGNQTYTDGRLLGGLTVFDAVGNVDLAFQQRVGVVETAGAGESLPALVRFYPDGRLLLTSHDGVFSSQATQPAGVLLRLLADGTPDNSFALWSGVYTPTIRTMAIQPDGKILLAGTGNRFSGVGPLIRLNADGSLDNGFSATIGGRANDFVTTIAVQTDGKILVGGLFVAPAPSLIRLLANGQLDPSFQANVASGDTVQEIVLRPSGQIIVAGGRSMTVQGQTRGLQQLSSTGTLDPGFQAPAGYGFDKIGDVHRIHLLRTGALVVLPTAPATAPVLRLLPSGQADPAFTAPAQLPVQPRVAVLDAAEDLVVGGVFRPRSAITSNLLKMQPSGQLAPYFAPMLVRPGFVSRMLEQPRLGVLLLGDFDLVNGYSSPNLVRLRPSSAEVDTAFSNRMPLTDNLGLMALQPPGNHLLIGNFSQLDGDQSSGIARLDSTGQLDRSFRRYQGVYGDALAAQPNGRFIVTGYMARVYSQRDAARFLANGDPDPSFTIAISVSLSSSTKVLIQPDSRILLLSSNSCLRVLPSGQYDTTFQPTVLTSERSRLIDDAVLQANGNITLCGQMPASVPGQLGALLRLLPDGRRDTTLTDPPIRPGYRARSITYHPDGRLLIGCSYFNSALQPHLILFPLLPNGRPDLGLQPVAGAGNVYATLRTSDGRLMAAGEFYYFANALQQQLSFVAFTAAQPLAVEPIRQPTPTVAAYPNPAHGSLHLRLDVAASPRRVQLLDALGRSVVTRPTTQSELTLDTAGLPAGLYLLRVEYASGIVTRRVVVE